MNALGRLAAILVLIAAVGVPGFSSAQKSVQEIETQYAQPPGGATPKKEEAKEQIASDLDQLGQQWRLTRLEIRYKESILVSIMGLLSLGLILWRMTRKTSQCSGGDIIHASGLVLIIFGTLFLVVIVEVDEQLTASIGILGAIAGYLFGRRTAAESGGPPAPPSGGSGLQAAARATTPADSGTDISGS